MRSWCFLGWTGRGGRGRPGEGGCSGRERRPRPGVVRGGSRRILVTLGRRVVPLLLLFHIRVAEVVADPGGLDVRVGAAGHADRVHAPAVHVGLPDRDAATLVKQLRLEDEGERLPPVLAVGGLRALNRRRVGVCATVGERPMTSGGAVCVAALLPTPTVSVSQPVVLALVGSAA